MRWRIAFTIITWFATIGGLHAEPGTQGETLDIYIDADFTVAWQAAQSIEHGISAALASRNFRVAGHQLRIVPVDHRGSARRSIENLRRFDEDQAAIAVIGGMQSPTYIPHLDEISDRRIPLLLAWSASGMLTRHTMGAENSIFRLSVDDTQVGSFLVGEMATDGCERFGTVVLDNGWGRGNRNAIMSALRDADRMLAYDALIATDIGTARAREIAAELRVSSVDCLALVGNGRNSAIVMNAIHELGVDLAVYSHWGILASGFADAVPHAARDAAQLTVVQSCGLDPNRRNEAQLRAALGHARSLGWDYNRLPEVPAPAGFVHGYDLGLMFVAALEQASAQDGWERDIATRRALLRDALEALEEPVDGILRRYERPFSAVGSDSMDAHESLSGDDLCLARFDRNGLLVDLSGQASTDEAALAP